MSDNKFRKALARPEVDPAQLAKFVGNSSDQVDVPTPAGTGQEEPSYGYVSLPEQEQGGKLTDSVLFRCTPAVLAELDFVFKHCTAKSRQKMLESIILPQINELAKKIRGSGSNGE
ncbi:hypothetical protein [Paludibacterium paludis]|uniref:Uncharacterized protein n=1 Tax=Paludibacterium paludis TaxID=1225769 RepID=A0A918NX35_9NEIS|nr:hypothetical protein [Paludibacterium paludis]GGY03932.1 hypothetical protein GCM10011289_02870 [Paludibacterium paludis]